MGALAGYLRGDDALSPRVGVVHFVQNSADVMQLVGMDLENEASLLYTDELRAMVPIWIQVYAMYIPKAK